MLDFTRKLHEDLLLQLEELDDLPDNKKTNPDLRILLLSNTIDLLKKKLKLFVFDSEDDEIHFFKNELPKFLSLFIYYSERGAIECSRTVGTEKSKDEFLKQILQKMEYFFHANADFFNYSRFGKTRFDKYYFLRNTASYNDHLDLPAFMMDESFCTIYSWKLATIIAYSRLEKEIRNSPTENVQDVSNEPGDKSFEEFNLAWTDTKRGLIELIYSLQEQGSFNNGQADLNSIIRCFEKTFSVELGNTSSSYQQILSRKKGSTSYLNKLVEKYEQRIGKIDEQPYRRR
jgi:RteC protein